MNHEKQEILLVGEHITKQYQPPKKEESRGIIDVSLVIRRGEFYGIVGRSGAGKSTLARVLAGIERPEQGTVTFYGKEVQMIFQNPFSAVNPKMNIEQIIMEPWTIRRWKKKRERKAKVEQMLELVGLPKSIKNHYPSEVSGGQLQRVVIARSLMLSPDLLIADEITASLDTTIQKQIMELLLQLREKTGLTCILISHNLAMVKQMCDRVSIVEHGKMIEERNRYGNTAIFETT